MDTTKINRITAASALVFFILLAMVLGMLASAPRRDARQRPSTFFSDPSGTKAILLVMQQLLPAAEQWRRSLLALPPVASNAVTTLIVCGPSLPLTGSEAAQLQSWIAAGGQLIFLADH